MYYGLWFHLLTQPPYIVLSIIAAAAAKLLQSCLTLCNPIDGSPPASPVPGILQARTLEWVATFFSNAWKCKVKVKSLSRVRLFTTPWTTGLPGSSVHGNLQTRILEWVPIFFYRGSSRPRNWTQVSCIVGRFFTVWATREALIDHSVLPNSIF